MSRATLVCIISLVFGVWTFAGAAGQSAFTEFSLPGDSAAWVVTSDNGPVPTLSTCELGQGVKLDFDRPEKATTFTLKLKKPIILPTNARRVGVWCYTSSRFWEADRGMLRFLLRDARGVGYSYTCYGSSPIAGSWNYIECPRFRAGELGRLDETMIRVEGGLQHHMPVAPLRFEGIELYAGSAGWIQKKSTVEFVGVAADGVKREASKLYWQSELGERYLFGEMPFAQKPFVTAGDLLAEPGDYAISWQARKAQYGRPVAQGEWTLKGFDASAKAKFQRFEIPLGAQGQYWVSFRIAKGDSLRRVDTRIKIIRGSSAQPGAISADVRPVGGLIVLNPQREENVYVPSELTDCQVRVWRPKDAPVGDLTLKVTRSRYPSGQIGEPETYTVRFIDKDYADIDLPLTLSASMPMQKLDMSVLADGKVIDTASEWVGQQSLPDQQPWTNRDKVLSWSDIFENGNHLLSCAEWDPRYAQNTDLAKFEEWVVDVKRQNVNTIELFPQIREIEPMPGVFWWDQLDGRLEIIAKHGLRAMINVDCTYLPSWMTEESQSDEEGMVNGLWHGGGNNVLKSPCSQALWQYYGEYLTHMTLRYRNEPSLVAYSSLSIFFDHVWADHPWQGQYVDYSESAKEGFRRYLRDVRGFSTEDLAKRWGKPVTSWDHVELPRTDLFLGLATIDRPDPRPEWQDFIDFRKWAQSSLFTGLIAGTMRKYDDLRPIGTHGLFAPEYYKAHRMFVCAGGSEGSVDGYRKGEPLPVRAESIAMSWYTPYYTAMSMTNRLATGNLNIQHFWMPGWRWDNAPGEDRMTGTHALAGWFELFQGDLGKAKPIHAADTGPKPVLGLMHSKASVLYGVRSFHTPRLDDYKVITDRACIAPKKMIDEDAAAEDLKSLPCVVVDPTARILPKETIDRLANYVRGGGKLVLAPTSGRFTLDPSDGDHVLRRALGLPVPASKWAMAQECRVPGVYAPYYPWDITGKGTPAEQSVSEPGQTMTTQAAPGSVFAGHKLTFRVGPYTMYNRDTWGDWSHMIPYFVYGRYKESKVDGGTVLATWYDGGPAATLHNVGKGQVVLLWGTPDWFNWRDALSDIAKWAAPAASASVATAIQPYEVSPEGFKGYILAKDETRWAVIRNETTGWTGLYISSEKQKDAKRQTGVIKLTGLSAANYHVQDVTPLLSQGYDRVLSREELETVGISADMIPSETRIFRLDPVK